MLAFLDEVIALFLGAFQRVFGLIAGLFGVALGFFELQFQIVQLGQYAVQTLVVVGRMAAGGVDDVLRDTQLSADEERIGLAGHADAELVGGHQRFDVELAAGVDDTGGFQRVDFHLGIVGGSHQQAALAAQLFQNADSQRSTLGGVGTGTQLVQQGQRTVPGQIQNAADALHVAGEGGKALLNALLVADIHKIFTEGADDAALMRWDQKAILRHGVEQASRFQRDRLTAGVGAGDDQRVIFIAQSDIHRHDLFLVDERVAGLVQLKANRIADGWHKRTLLDGKAGLGQQQVNFQHCVIAVAELRLQRADLCRERGQNAGDLLLLLCAQLHDAGIGFDHGGGLDKDGSAGGRNIVDDAADLAAVLGTHGHNIAAITQRDDRVLQKFVGSRILDDGIQLGADGIFSLADLAAQIGQRGAGGIGHLFGRKDAVRDLPLQHGLRGQRVEQVVGGHHVMLTQAVPLAESCKIAQCGGDFQQFTHREDAALLGVGNHAPHLRDRAKARAAVFDQQAVDGVGLFQGIAFILGRFAGLQGLHHFLGFAAGTQLHRPGKDLVQFQCLFICGIHGG